MNGPRIPLERLVLVGLLVFLGSANVLLIRQNLQMRAQLKGLQRDALKVGSKAWAFSARGLGGDAINVHYDGAGPKRVFFFFSPDCSYCHDQFPYWQQVLDRGETSKFEIIGLASESEDKTKLAGYLKSVGAESLRVALVTSDVLRNYKLAVTPTTVLVSNDGRVEAVWTGAWTEDIRSVASSTFGVSIRPK